MIIKLKKKKKHILFNKNQGYMINLNDKNGIKTHCRNGLLIFIEII